MPTELPRSLASSSLARARGEHVKTAGCWRVAGTKMGNNCGSKPLGEGTCLEDYSVLVTIHVFLGKPFTLNSNFC